MPNWTESMQQTFKYYIVNPDTWADEKELKNIISCTISWDSAAETLGSASIETTEMLGECYVRIYLVTIQNGVEEDHVLGTFLIQTPSSNTDGKINSISADAYSPLLELKEKYPSSGYYIPKSTEDKKVNIMDTVYEIITNNNLVRAPVIKTPSSEEITVDFVADPDDNWLKFLTEFISNADHYFDLDERGNILFVPKQEFSALQPKHTFESNEISILYPDVTVDRDLYGIPNSVEVVCSSPSGEMFYYKVENNDPDSPTSIVNRGREIMHRDTNPSIVGTATQVRIQEYAEALLKKLSSVEHTLTFSHGYYPVRPGDCVRIIYPEAGLDNIKVKIISQSIKCEPGCPVTSKAVYTTKYWG